MLALHREPSLRVLAEPDTLAPLNTGLMLLRPSRALIRGGPVSTTRLPFQPDRRVAAGGAAEHVPRVTDSFDDV